MTFDYIVTGGHLRPCLTPTGGPFPNSEGHHDLPVLTLTVRTHGDLRGPLTGEHSFIYVGYLFYVTFLVYHLIPRFFARFFRPDVIGLALRERGTYSRTVFVYVVVIH